MDHMVSREAELEIDLESGGTTSEEDITRDLNSENRKSNKILNRVWDGILSFDGSVKGECGINSCSSSSKFGDTKDENVELLIDNNSELRENSEHAALLQKKSVEVKHKKTNTRKPPKPPRPPRGPSLDAADQKFVREMTELAMRKRARIERIKTLKKMRAAKASSSSSSLSALVITLLFCVIIIFQALCCRNFAAGMWFRSNASMGLQGSPAPAVAASEGLISIQFYDNFFSADKGNEPSPNSFIPAETGTSSEEVKRSDKVEKS